MKTIKDLFEQQVNLRNGQIALKFHDKHYTYAQLDHYANQLAHHLLNQGALRGDVIAVSLKPSLELIMAILATLKVGGTFLPLEASHPHKRLTAILENSNPKFIIAESITLSELPIANRLDIQAVALDKIEPLLQQQSKKSPELLTDANDLAYIIYTSGSTGSPKGVPINQQGITKWLTVWQQTLHMSAEDQTALFPSVNFDAGIWDIFRALLTGGTLYLLNDEQRSHLGKLTKAINKNKITSITVPPAILTELKSEQLPAGLKIVSTGEAFNANIIQLFTQHNILLFNGYGPTEVGVGATLYPVKRAPEAGNSVPIGQPIPGMQFYFLTDGIISEPQADTEAELLIGGAGITPGYINLPAKTQEALIPHPTIANQYFYRTQDRVRFGNDGLFYYAGRMTRQVKLHGQMLNLDEIEACLNAYPSIKQSAVVIQERKDNNKILAAFYVADEGSAIQVQALQQFLQKTLPLYMVPCAFVHLEALPLTSNGKIDRQQLAIQVQQDIQRDTLFVAPKGKLELHLQRLWGDVLSLEATTIGAHDSFWQLGGDSINLAKLLLNISDTLKVDLNHQHFKQFDTIASLAGLIRYHVNNPIISIQSVPNKPVLFCLPDITGHAGNQGPYVNLPDQLKEYTILGLEAPRVSDINGLCSSLDELAYYFYAAIRAQQPQGPYYFIGYSLGATLAVKLAALFEKEKQKVELLALIDAPAPILFEQMTSEQQAEQIKKTVQRLIEYLNKKYNSHIQLTYDQQANNIDVGSNTELISRLFKNITGINSKIVADEIALIEANSIAAMQPNLTQTKLACSKIFLYCTQELRNEFIRESSLGWDNYFEELIDVVFIPGDHSTILGTMFSRWSKHLADAVYKAVYKTSTHNNLEDKLEQRLDRVEKSVKQGMEDTMRFLERFQSFFLASCTKPWGDRDSASTSPEEKTIFPAALVLNKDNAEDLTMTNKKGSRICIHN